MVVVVHGGGRAWWWSRMMVVVHGGGRALCRNARPHVVLGPDGFTPVALTTAVIDSPIGEWEWLSFGHIG